MKTILAFFLCMLSVTSFSQSVTDTINEEDTKRHVNYLASDKLRGRVNFTKEQLEAAEYISKEFTLYGLKPYPGYSNYYQPFYFASGNKQFIYRDSYTTDDTALYNIVGVIPGKSKPDEMIIFSAHYDHVNWGLSGDTGGIFNGANDNASGTAAVLMLANYFSMRNDNERTLVFCLFAAEELGLFGSIAFAKTAEPEKIKAVINIEMIGRTNRTGKNGFIVTGSQYSDLADILKNNLKGEKVKVRNEGTDVTGLYSRSDNYSFAKKGIPAHSIMCSDDKEDCYHKPCDDAKWIDTKNMTRVIQAIAKGCTTLISGGDTPRRIKL
jgi:Zn-dependent M28 family amino/carboxypeptidase